MNPIQQQQIKEILSKCPRDKRAALLKAAASKALAKRKKVNNALKAFDDLLKTKRGMPKSGTAFDPKVVVAKIGALLIGKGTVKFVQWARSIIQASRTYGIPDNDIKPFLKLTYGAITTDPQAYNLTDDDSDLMDLPSVLRKTDIDSI